MLKSIQSIYVEAVGLILSSDLPVFIVTSSATTAFPYYCLLWILTKIFFFIKGECVYFLRPSTMKLLMASTAWSLRVTEMNCTSGPLLLPPDGKTIQPVSVVRKKHHLHFLFLIFLISGMDLAPHVPPGGTWLGLSTENCKISSLLNISAKVLDPTKTSRGEFHEVCLYAF